MARKGGVSKMAKEERADGSASETNEQSPYGSSTPLPRGYVSALVRVHSIARKFSAGEVSPEARAGFAIILSIVNPVLDKVAPKMPGQTEAPTLGKDPTAAEVAAAVASMAKGRTNVRNSFINVALTSRALLLSRAVEFAATSIDKDGRRISSRSDEPWTFGFDTILVDRGSEGQYGLGIDPMGIYVGQGSRSIDDQAPFTILKQHAHRRLRLAYIRPDQAPYRALLLLSRYLPAFLDQAEGYFLSRLKDDDGKLLKELTRKEERERVAAEEATTALLGIGTLTGADMDGLFLRD